MKITLNTSSFAQNDSRPLALLHAKGMRTEANPYKRVMTEAEVISFCADADGIIAGTEPLNAQVLSQLPHLKVISRCGVGMSNVDLRTAKEKGIKVYSTPTGPTLAVAELAVGLILSLLRQTGRMDRVIRAGGWDKRTGHLLAGKTVGIVGFGRIGRKLAELLIPWGVKVLYTDLQEVETTFKATHVPLDNLLANSDIVTLHVSLEDGKLIMSEVQFSLMKKGAWFLNLSRGEAIDENALYVHLKNGQLSGAALDVFAKEPYLGPLQTLDNVILTPHIGSYAMEARVLMELEASENLLKGFNIH